VFSPLSIQGSFDGTRFEERCLRQENRKRMCSENYRFEERCVRQERTGRDIVLGI